MGQENRFHRLCGLVFVALSVISLATGAHADLFSYTGSFGSATDVHTQTFTLTAPYGVTVQTYGFGGGTNAAGQVIAAGGFDPLIALFDGTGNIINGTSDTLFNYYTTPFFGCPPAGMVTIGTGAGADVCGDISMFFFLGPGTYTLVLADANYQPNALIQPGSTNLSDGFTDFTGGVFQTCNVTSDGPFCITPDENWAYDINLPVPEPATWSLIGGALGLAWLRRKYLL